MKRFGLIFGSMNAMPHRNRAILALASMHDSRVSKIAGPKLDDLDFMSVIMVLGKRRKVRTVYLTDQAT